MPAGAVHSSPAPVTSVDSTFVWPAPMPPPTPRPRPPTTAIAAPRQAAVTRTHRLAEVREDARTHRLAEVREDARTPALAALGTP